LPIPFHSALEICHGIAHNNGRHPMSSYLATLPPKPKIIAMNISQTAIRPWIFLILALVPAAINAADKPGEKIYVDQCARCHGKAGEGVAKVYAQPLIGQKSVKQLAKYISETMPEDDPGSCKGPDADAVAEYIHESFYSPAAQARNKPARIELARLTNKQYRYALSDLVGSFRQPLRMVPERGLKGEYYNARNARGDKKVIDRIDPRVSFDWKTESPEPGKIDAIEFAAQWTGSVIAPETGTYEFVVKCDHAVRLWVNDLNKPLIDAFVKSGKDNEFRGSISMLAGRPYSLKLEFSKAKQGVNDSKKNPVKTAAPSMIHLEWKRPQGVQEVIDGHYLMPTRSPEAFVVSTAFPPDDRSFGWERGTTVSKAWDQATTDGALELAAYIVTKSNELAGTKIDAADRMDKIKVFLTKFTERAFRRPLSEEQKKLFIDKQFEATKEPEAIIKRIVLLTLKSPRFLYREANTGNDAYDMASRLSFGLWDSIPDQLLLEDARNGKLKTQADLTRHAERMANDPRATAKIRDFLLFWVKADQAADIAKDPKRFPGFDAAMISDLRSSLERYLEEVITSPTADFRQFFTSDQMWMNGRLSQFYSGKLAAGATFQKVKLNPEEPRAGVLTHPYLMTRFAYTGTTSPIHRGVFLARGILGVALRVPQEAFTPLAEDLHPTLTTRERVELQTKPAACQACHNIINPLGFTLENFDAVGKFRLKDNNKLIDAMGSYDTRAGQNVKFKGPGEFAKFLVNSPDVQGTFVEQLFHNLVQQSIRAYGTNRREELRASFEKNQFNIKKLMIEIVATSALKGRSNQTASTKP
jgi:mono/diheme cytochrome c family protein